MEIIKNLQLTRHLTLKMTIQTWIKETLSVRMTLSAAVCMLPYFCLGMTWACRESVVGKASSTCFLLLLLSKSNLLQRQVAMQDEITQLVAMIQAMRKKLKEHAYRRHVSCTSVVPLAFHRHTVLNDQHTSESVSIRVTCTSGVPNASYGHRVRNDVICHMQWYPMPHGCYAYRRHIGAYAFTRHVLHFPVQRLQKESN